MAEQGKMLAYYLLLVIGALKLLPTAAQQLCGKLNETQFYNGGYTTAFDEYTWMGRFGCSSFEELTFVCQAVLINKRHALASAHCTSSTERLQNNDYCVVLFGDWLANDDTTTGDCNHSNECIPAPQVYTVQEIIVHPESSPVVGDWSFNIAVLRFEKEVQFSDYVQPICLPPAKNVEGNYIGQRLQWVGFPNPRTVRENSLANTRTKLWLLTTSLDHCISMYRNKNLTFSSGIICGYAYDKFASSSGSALMAAHVVDDKPQNFYLVGLGVFESRLQPKKPNGFIRIWPLREWILKNSS